MAARRSPSTSARNSAPPLLAQHLADGFAQGVNVLPKGGVFDWKLDIVAVHNRDYVLVGANRLPEDQCPFRRTVVSKLSKLFNTRR